MIKIDKSIPFDKYLIYIVGVGGTGARLLRDFSGFAYSLKKTEFKDIKIYLRDDDVVTEPNIFRQPFCHEDIGLSKAEILAERYSSGYDMEIRYTTERLQSANELIRDFNNYRGYVPVIVGCVDNLKARKIFHEVFENYKHPLIWLDSGNEQVSGQTVCGVKGNGGNVLFPSLTRVFPEILDMEDDPDSVSCSNVPITDIRRMSQYLVTNMQAATILLNYLTLILLGMDINCHITNFDVTNVQVRSEYIDYEKLLGKMEIVND